MTVEVSIEDYAEQHLEPLFELFASYFPAGDRLLTPEYSRWLYADNPFGPARLVKACEGPRWVGFMAMIPVQLISQREVLKAYYVVNVLVHPEYHGKHIFSRMITAAKDLVKTEAAALMGHPNDLALKQWQRSRMNFHEPLRPLLAWPLAWPGGLKARRVAGLVPLKDLAAVLTKIVSQSAGWRVAVTPEYLEWRYLRHPNNVYVVQLLQHGSQTVGVQVTKRVKAAAHLLVDQFMLPEHAVAATRRLPRLTICFWPESVAVRRRSAALPLPWKKRLPMFLTHTGQPVDAHRVADIGLSASDF